VATVSNKIWNNVMMEIYKIVTDAKGIAYYPTVVMASPIQVNNAMMAIQTMQTHAGPTV